MRDLNSRCALLTKKFYWKIAKQAIQPICPILAVNRLNWQCCLAGSSKTAPRILIFSIAMGADCSFYMKTIETHVRAFLTLNILAIGRVSWKDSKYCFLSMFLSVCFDRGNRILLNCYPRHHLNVLNAKSKINHL